MALDVKYSACLVSNCKSLRFGETTGAYHVDNNPTGWGAVGGGDPNDMLSDATNATLTLTGPSGVTYAPVDLVATASPFPKDDPSVTLDIAASTVDPSLTKFVDGFWEITYDVTTDVGGTVTTYSETKTLFFYCNAEACVCSMMADLDLSDCNCDPDKMNKALKARTYLDALCYASGCGNLDGANEILKTLTKMCGC